MENLLNNQELLQLVIISSILKTQIFDSEVMLSGEIWCWSLLRVKGLRMLFNSHEGFAKYCISVGG